jgi:hypothetical protein
MHRESECKQNQERGGNTKPPEKKVESNIDSATHNQTLKQQNQINDKNHHIPINTNTKD